MAQEVKDTTVATGSDMSELLDNVGTARSKGWVAKGLIVPNGRYLTQTVIKLGALDTASK